MGISMRFYDLAVLGMVLFIDSGTNYLRAICEWFGHPFSQFHFNPSSGGQREMTINHFNIPLGVTKKSYNFSYWVFVWSEVNMCAAYNFGLDLNLEYLEYGISKKVMIWFDLMESN